MVETRRVQTSLDEDGVTSSSHSMSSASDDTADEVVAPPAVAVPIVFLPGVMGSNLRAKRDIHLNAVVRGKPVRRQLARAGDRIWDVDKAAKMSLSEGPLDWLGRGPAERQLLLNRENVEVDDRGMIAEGQDQRPGAMGSTYSTPSGRTEHSELPLAKARARGWGQISWYSYGPFVDWLEEQLNGGAMESSGPNAVLNELLQLSGATPPGVAGSVDALREEQITKLLDIYFPVHALGYNWLNSNLDSGEEVARGIEAIIQQYQERHVCEKVIVVTHSMGGLVARAASEASGARDNILAVIHGVMPTDGAALFYKRLIGGGFGEGGGVVGYMTAQVLGATAQETTPVLGHAPGPLELAPNQLYNGGRPWLFINAAAGGTMKSLPESGNPYNEIYRAGREWWRAINLDWLNPAQLPDSLPNHVKALAKAQGYHLTLGNAGFHPETYAHYGRDDGERIWGTVTWTATAMEGIRGGPGNLPQAWQKRPSLPIAGDPANWSVDYQWGGRPTRSVDDGLNERVRCEIEPAADPGDGTVPADQGAAGVSRANPKVLCVTAGHDHQSSYDSNDVRRFVIDAVARVAASVTV
ncbi:esterase/lipase family protein [Alloalcanivorax balearicus]|nr:GPI inositol-deacylase [Alloalcanivorax balearicus]